LHGSLWSAGSVGEYSSWESSSEGEDGSPQATSCNVPANHKVHRRFTMGVLRRIPGSPSREQRRTQNISNSPLAPELTLSNSYSGVTAYQRYLDDRIDEEKKKGKEEVDLLEDTESTDTSSEEMEEEADEEEEEEEEKEGREGGGGGGGGGGEEEEEEEEGKDNNKGEEAGGARRAVEVETTNDASDATEELDYQWPAEGKVCFQ